MSGEGIQYHQRVLVLGQTRSGKSELINHLASAMRCQLFFLDTKGGEWAIDGVEPVKSIYDVDWSQRIILLETVTDEITEIDEIFGVLRTRKGICVVAHELADLCGHSTNRTPMNVSAYYSKGGAHRQGILGGSQVPVDMPARGRSEVQHVFVVVPAMGEDNLKAIARVGIGVDWKELKALLEDVEHAHGEHSFVWFRKGVKGYTICPPLPAAVIAQTIVKRPHGVL
jgi:hypothetical protein